MKEVLDILRELKLKHVYVELVGKELKLKGQIRLLTKEQIEKVKSNKEKMIHVLSNSHEQNKDQIKFKAPSINGAFELSEFQKGIWFALQLPGRSNDYNVSIQLKLNGHVDPIKLELAINKTIEKHPALRTVFIQNEGLPYQRIIANVSIKIQQIEGITSSDISQAISNQNNNAFDLENGPLLRASLFSITNEAFVFSLCVHHLVVDGWSMGIILNEISQFYKGQGNLNHSALNGAIDHLDWSLKPIDAELKENVVEFWKKQFNELNAYANSFPYSGYKKGSKRSGERMYFEIETEISYQVIEYCRTNKVTLFNFYFTIFNILLYKYNREQNLIIGVPFANRSTAIIEKTVGNLVNALPVKTNLNSALSLKSALLNSQQSNQSFFKQQAVPFSQVQKELRSSGELGTEELMKTLFTFQNVTIGDKNKAFNFGDDIAIDSAYKLFPNGILEDVPSKFDLAIQIGHDFDGELLLEIEYRTDLYERKRISEIYQNFAFLIDQYLLDDTLEIANIALLSNTEQSQKITAPLNAIADLSITNYLFREIAQYNKNEIALLNDSDTTGITYEQLSNYTDNIAGRIKKGILGNSKNNVGIFLTRNSNAVMGILGVLKAGKAYVPINITYPEDRIKFIIQDAGLDLVLVDENTQSELKNYCLDIEVLLLSEAMYTESTENITITEDLKEEVAYIIYTSGSTGTPKGVEITHGNALNFLAWAKDEFKQTDFDVLYSATSYCFDLSVFEYLYPLIAGKKLRIVPHFSAFSSLLKKDEKVFLNTVPSVIKTLIEQGENFEHVAAINMAGEVIPYWIKETLDFDRMEIRNLYGPSEDTTYSTCYRFANDGHKLVPIGQPIRGTQFAIRDKDGNEVPEGVAGELCLSGPCIAKGYLNRPEKTAEAFIQDAHFNHFKSYKTGDICRQLSDGQIEFIGREDHQIKLRGFRIEIGEIKKIIEEHPNVIQAEIILVQEQLCCVWNGQAENDEEIRDWAKDRLLEYMLPYHYLKLVEFPLNNNGKVDQKILNDQVNTALKNNHNYQEPKTELEKQLATIWEKVLNHAKIGINDDFYRLGGQSLTAVKLHHEITTKLHYDVRMEQTFQCKTIAELAQLLKGTKQVELTHIPKLGELENKPSNAICKQTRVVCFEPMIEEELINELKKELDLKVEFLASKADTIAELTQLLDQIRKEAVQLGDGPFFGLTFIRIQSNLTLVVLTFKQEEGNQNLHELFMNCLGSKYQNILELKQGDENESFEELRQTATWSNELPANYFSLKDLLIEKSDTYQKSTYELSNDVNIDYNELSARSEAQKITLLLAVLQKVLWKVARINFVNFKKVSWRKNESLTQYIFVKTKDDNSLLELTKVLDAQEAKSFNSKYEKAFIEKTKTKWPTFFNDVLVLEGAKDDAFNEASKDHFLTINFKNKASGFKALFTINEDAICAPFLLTIGKQIKAEFEQLSQNIAFINLHINNVEPIVAKGEIEPDMDDVEFNF